MRVHPRPSQVRPCSPSSFTDGLTIYNVAPTGRTSSDYDECCVLRTLVLSELVRGQIGGSDEVTDLRLNGYLICALFVSATNN